MIKKILFGLVASALSFGILGGAPQYAFAQSPAVSTNKSITLTQGQTEFIIPLTIEHPGNFAGVELAVQTGSGIKITQIDYSRTLSTAGPVSARGLVWFSNYSANNDFSSALTATVHATYDGTANTQVVIDHAAFYTKDGTKFNTQNLPLRTTIAINREGAANTPGALTPPKDGSTATSSGNPASGTAAGSKTSSKATKKSSTSKTSTTNTTSPAATTATATTDAAPTSLASALTDNTPKDNALSSDTLTIPNDTVPLTSGAGAADANSLTANNVSGGVTEQLNILSLIVAILCAATAVFLGLLLIKNRKKYKNQDNKEVR